ncbi:hypothetical protein DPMN_087747 [Dreissena polymorpha]|uniref:Uncharacterized protein n=1 Tax=Dreissena polymorpha TaxID=45954 RepID=A0A9D4KT89_DREPO|nr:hypothetical protein DPMN_087747 [Dreissena polymorpha]
MLTPSPQLHQLRLPDQTEALSILEKPSFQTLTPARPDRYQAICVLLARTFQSAE